MKSSLFLLALLGASAVMAAPAPLQDLSTTSVTLEEEQTSSDSEHLTVKISRVDDLVDDNGAVLIERVMGVKLGFDIEDDKILLNGAPLELGPSSIEIEAYILADESLLPPESDQADVDALIPLTNALDIGLVTVEVEANVERITTEEGIPIRHIVVSERIVEINGAQVYQTEAQQHILDIFENGTVVETLVAADSQTTPFEPIIPVDAPYEVATPLEIGSWDEESLPCGGVNRWLLQINPHVRLAILGFFSSILCYAFIILVGRIVRKKRGYTQVTIEETEAVWSDEKDAKAVEILEVESVEGEEEGDEKKGLLN